MPREKKKTRVEIALDEQREEFERRTAMLSATREAFLAMRKGEIPIKVESGVDEETHREVEVIALTRSNGGVVILEENDVRYIDEWIRDVRASYEDPYLRDLVSKVQHTRNEAIKRRFQPGGEGR